MAFYKNHLIRNNINTQISNNQTTSLSKSIAKVLAYFDVFEHPLTLDEIINLGNSNHPTSTYKETLEELIKKEVCYKYQGFYSINSNIKDFVLKRKNKEFEAKKYFSKLPLFVNLISKFPFVRGVAISGSLSKGVMHDDGDIDYFIITAPERLWICRTILILFKKVFLLNSKKYFCINYFVDENNLNIIDRNIFTAIEITYLLPVFNDKLIQKLKQENDWTNSYFPHFNHPIELNIDSSKKKRFKGNELVFNTKLANHLDLWLMKLTFKRWRKKFSHFKEAKFELTMRTNRGISKHHPQDFQNKVLKKLKNKLEQLDS